MREELVLHVQGEDSAQRDEDLLELRITAMGDDALQAVERGWGSGGFLFWVLS